MKALMAFSWHRNGPAMWYCHGTTMWDTGLARTGPPWITMGLPWGCHWTAMRVPWKCHETTNRITMSCNATSWHFMALMEPHGIRWHLMVQLHVTSWNPMERYDSRGHFDSNLWHLMAALCAYIVSMQAPWQFLHGSPAAVPWRRHGNAIAAPWQSRWQRRNRPHGSAMTVPMAAFMDTFMKFATKLSWQPRNCHGSQVHERKSQIVHERAGNVP